MYLMDASQRHRNKWTRDGIFLMVGFKYIIEKKNLVEVIFAAQNNVLISRPRRELFEKSATHRVLRQLAPVNV